jgi:hypothetical protein
LAKVEFQTPSESVETNESVERQNTEYGEDYKVESDPLTDAEEAEWQR